MRLTERRFSIKSSITYHNGDGEFDARTAISTTAPFVRPCAIIKMYNENNLANENQKMIISRPSTSTLSSSSPPSALMMARRKFENENDMEANVDASASHSNINR